MKKKLISLALVLAMLISIAPMALAYGQMIRSMYVQINYGSSSTIKVGDITGLTAQITPSGADIRTSPKDGSTLCDSITWTSSDPSILSVEIDGHFYCCDAKGLKPGKVYVSATTKNGLTDGVYITVLPSDATGINLVGKTSIKIGQSTQWKAMVTPTTASQSVKWTSETPDVATVDANGKITAINEGQSKITATAENGKKKTVLITVTSDPAKSIAFAGKTTIKPGQSTQWKVMVTPTTASQSVKWTSGNPGVATVDANGNITGHKSGQAHITATSANGVKKTVLINVVADPAKSVNLAGAVTIIVGKTTQWKATITPSTANQIVTWKSGNPGVATVDANGKITAKKPGKSHITATAANGVKKTVMVNVIANAPTEINISCSKTTMNQNDYAKISAYVLPNGVDGTLTCSSSNPSVVNFAFRDGKGEIYAKNPGTATITIKAQNGVSKSVTITVLKGCYLCHGSGYIDCLTCNGGGSCRSCNGAGMKYWSWSGYVNCSVCYGSGRCSVCKGTGTRRCYYD